MKNLLIVILSVLVFSGVALGATLSEKATIQNTMKTSILNGTPPLYDGSIPPDEFVQLYIDIAKDSGVDFDKAREAKDYNLYRLIRNAEKVKGTVVKVSKDAKVETANSLKDL